MPKNYVQEGEILSYKNTGPALTAGTAFVTGKRMAVALVDIPTNASGSISVSGVWAVPKVPGDNPVIGDLLYWDDANDRLTVTAAGNILSGYCAEAPAANAAVVNIKINA
jgi:predicted RecA/RadA family phage recombinase